MYIIKIGKSDDQNQAISKFRRGTKRLVQEMRDRQFYKKPSNKRHEQKKRNEYRDEMKRLEEDQS